MHDTSESANQRIDQLKKTLSNILGRALAGYTDDYKFVVDGRTYIQWGKVEKDMHAAIDGLSVATNVAEGKLPDTPPHSKAWK